MNDSNKNHTRVFRTSRNLISIGLVLIGVFLIIIARLAYLQIHLNHIFFNQAQKNFLRVETIQSPRGNILDAHGALLATNRPVKNVYWHGTGKKTLSPEQLQALSFLETVIGKPLTNTKLIQAEKKRHNALLAADINFEQLSQIAERFPNHNNITIDTSFKRYYPYKSYASHILGYLGRITSKEHEGIMGLEKMLDTKLKGEYGKIVKTIDSFGKNLASKKLKDALIGNDVQTTLDIRLQEIIENIFPHEHTGTIILMNPEDGAILALLSRPSFDPSLFLQPITHEHWQRLQEKKPFLNRACGASYPPGSIFKLVTISAALEENIITQDTCWHCDGYHTFAGRNYWCHRRYGHGDLTTKQAVAQSCNVIFYQLAERISIDVLAKYAHKFGLGTTTGSVFPEQSGLIPTTEWKMLEKGERWWPGETLSASIGQSFMLATPLQVARMISAIFTGYLTTPRILADEPVQTIPLELKPQTIEFLQESMRAVVTRGTGRRLNQVKNFELFAKTSTAQTSALGKRKLGTKYKEHGWFVAHLRYKQNKPLTIVVLAEHAGSSRVATNIAKNFLIAYKKLMDKTG